MNTRTDTVRLFDDKGKTDTDAVQTSKHLWKLDAESPSSVLSSLGATSTHVVHNDRVL